MEAQSSHNRKVGGAPFKLLVRAGTLEKLYVA